MSLSPGKKINKSKKVFDEAFLKEAWEIHPTMIAFFTPMQIRSLIMDTGEHAQGFLIMTAPVNHNKLNHNKTIQIVHTILANKYQSENEVTIANQDFGNDASLVVGYHCKTLLNKTNQVEMKNLHPEQEEQQKINYSLFHSNKDAFLSELQSEPFKKILKTDATTTEGRNDIATYFGVKDK